MTTHQKHLQPHWKSFARKVINNDAGQTQRDEMQLAWYAGAMQLFQMLTQLPDMPEEEYQSLFIALEQELKEQAEIQLTRLDTAVAKAKQQKTSNPIQARPFEFRPDISVHDFIKQITDRIDESSGTGLEFNIGAQEKSGEAYVLSFAIDKTVISVPADVTRH